MHWEKSDDVLKFHQYQDKYIEIDSERSNFYAVNNKNLNRNNKMSKLRPMVEATNAVTV